MAKHNLCSVFLMVLIATVVSTAQAHRIEKRSGTCVLPPYPDHGTYKIAGDSSAKPGDDLKSAFLNVTCSQGYGVVGNNVVVCVDGVWSTKMPQCTRFCHLPPHPSVEYHCMKSGSADSRPCNEYEPLETNVRPECRSPYYYHTGHLPHMRCIDGSWDYVAVCSQECGRISESEDLILHGKESQLPWRVDINKKDKDTYNSICGGSIISNTVIVTAAHCFSSDSSTNIVPSDFSVMVGKTHRGLDVNEQKFSVSEVKIPARYQGILANFQDDIAVLILSSPIVYSEHVKPVCVDFDNTFERKQLQEKLGKLAVWSNPTEKTDTPLVMELPYIPINECIHRSTAHFREYITSDKMCAGHANGTVMCRGNSGSGISFPDKQRSVTRYYLRGVMSTAPKSLEPTEGLCDTSNLIAFTQINKHENFLKQYLV